MRIGADLCLGWQAQEILDLGDQVFASENAGLSFPRFQSDIYPVVGVSNRL
jgi:hypothetical protein